MNKSKFFAAIFVLMLSGSVFGALEKVEEAMELELVALRLAGADVGVVTINACETCEKVELNVDSNTRYQFKNDGQVETLERTDFDRIVRNARRQLNKEHPVMVFYAPETLTIKRIVLSSVSK